MLFKKKIISLIYNRIKNFKVTLQKLATDTKTIPYSLIHREGIDRLTSYMGFSLFFNRISVPIALRCITRKNRP